MEVRCPRPPVRNDIVTPRHLFGHFSPVSQNWMSSATIWTINPFLKRTAKFRQTFSFKPQPFPLHTHFGNPITTCCRIYHLTILWTHAKPRKKPGTRHMSQVDHFTKGYTRSDSRISLSNSSSFHNACSHLKVLTDNFFSHRIHPFQPSNALKAPLGVSLFLTLKVPHFDSQFIYLFLSVSLLSVSLLFVSV